MERRIIGGFWEVDQGRAWVVEEPYDVASEDAGGLLDFTKPPETIYTNTDKPDTAHQLDAETVPAEVAYTRTNTQPSCSGGGESDRVLNAFKEAVGLPQAAHWKTASDKENNTIWRLR